MLRYPPLSVTAALGYVLITPLVGAVTIDCQNEPFPYICGRLGPSMQVNVRQLHFECVAVTVRSSLSALVLVSLLLGLYVVICSWQCSSKQQVLCVGSAYQCCSMKLLSSVPCTPLCPYVTVIMSCVLK